MSKQKKAHKSGKQQAYLLTHDQLGVLLGFMELPLDEEGTTAKMVPMFSNFEAGGRSEAIILWPDMKLLPILDDIKNQMRDFGPEGFTLTPVKCKPGKLFLPMRDCAKLGVPKWNDLPTMHYSAWHH